MNYSAVATGVAMDPPPYDVRLVTYGLTSAWESDPRVALVKEELSKRGFRVGDSRRQELPW